MDVRQPEEAARPPRLTGPDPPRDKRRVRRILGLVLCLLVPAHSASAALRAHLRRPARGLQARLTPFSVPAAHEREVCQAITLPNTKPMDVDEITVAMPSGAEYSSHHFAIFLYTGADPSSLPRDPIDSVGCVGVGDEGVAPILAFVQRSRQRIGFSRRVGVRLAPHQRVIFNSHYVNGSPEPVEPDVAVNFRKARRGAVEHHARSFQLGTLHIDVPPGAAGSAVGEWRVPFPMNVVWLSTHSHKHTQSAVIEVERAAGRPPELQVTTHEYSDPNVHTYEPALRLEPGDRVHWTCDYLNSTSARLHFGVTAEDEMCFAVGFFYPDDDAAPLPAVPRCFGDGLGLVCPFN
jgi:hypothetical protein